MLKNAQYPIKKRIKLYGFDISIENPKGSSRHWKDPHSGESGSTLMRYDYGYIRRTEGTDGDHVDVYVGPNPESDRVFIVNQMKKPDFKEFDEHKTMMAFPNATAAKAAYLKQYNDPRFFGSMKEMSIADFRKWVHSSATKKQASALGLQPRPDSRRADSKVAGDLGVGAAGAPHLHSRGTIPSSTNGVHSDGSASRKTASREGSVHGRVVNSESLGDHLYGETGIPQRDSFFDRPLSGAAVLASMLERGQHLKVAQLVVQPVPVSVMNDFISAKGPTEVPLHYHTMLEPLPALVVDQPVRDPVESSFVSMASRGGHEAKYASHSLNGKEKQMPFTSKRQQRAAFAGAIPGFSKEKALEWAHETPNLKKLPDRAPAEKGKPTLRSKVSAEDRVSRLSDRVDDAGIGVLAAPYAADLVGHGLSKMKNPKLQAAGHAISRTLGNESAFGKSHARELVGLGMVAPGITHRVAKGIDKALPAEKKAKLEKIAKELYPDYEYLPFAEQEKIAANLMQVGQSALKSFRQGASRMADAARGIKVPTGLSQIARPGPAPIRSAPVMPPIRDMSKELHPHMHLIPEVPAAARVAGKNPAATPVAATPAAPPVAGAPAAAAPKGRGRLAGMALTGAGALGVGGVGIGLGNAMTGLQRAQEESVAAPVLAPSMYQGAGRVF